jgi:2-octaprenyl-6-methoxyphenol hydroxylase
MAGIAAREFGYKQTAIVCTVTHEQPHNGVAHEHFLPAGPFAMLPMTDERLADGTVRHRSSIVWSEDPRLVPMLLKLDDAAFGKEIERRFGSSLWPGAAARPALLLSAHHGAGRQLCAAAFALTGDAAHGIHPIAGQGFNLGVRDVAALAEVLVDAVARRARSRRHGRAGPLCALAAVRQSHAVHLHGRPDAPVLQRLRAAAHGA